MLNQYSIFFHMNKVVNDFTCYKIYILVVYFESTELEILIRPKISDKLKTQYLDSPVSRS